MKILPYLACSFLLSSLFSMNVQAQTDSDDETPEIEIWDPIESVNRDIFEFNDTLDVYVLEPVAKGYDDITPQPVKTGITNFFRNLAYPSELVSDIVSLKFQDALEHTGRFAINTTVGVLGVMDIAKEVGLKRKVNDFGLALAADGVPPGPYLMLPFLGPSNVRDGAGSIVDTVLNPIFWIPYSNASTAVKVWVPIATRAIEVVNQRARLLEAVKAAKESSLDYYLFVQSAYYQYREGLLKSGGVADGKSEFGPVKKKSPEE